MDIIAVDRTLPAAAITLQSTTNACTVDGTNMLEMHVWLNLRHAGHAQNRDTMRWCAGQPRDPTTRQSIRSVTPRAKRTSQAHFLRSVDKDLEFDNYWTATLSVDGHPTRVHQSEWSAARNHGSRDSNCSHQEEFCMARGDPPCPHLHTHSEPELPWPDNKSLHPKWPAMLTPQQASMRGAGYGQAHWHTGQLIHTRLHRRVPRALLLPGNSTRGCLSIHAPKKIAHPLIPKVKMELGNMEKQGVFSPVTEPTSWCSGIVVVPKPNGSIHICVDLTHLNKAVQREVHPMFSAWPNWDRARFLASSTPRVASGRSHFAQSPDSSPPSSRPLATSASISSPLASVSPVKSSSGQCHRS